MTQGALSREPAWIQSALEVLSALQMDGEWLLGLSEAEQVTVAQVTSAKDAGGALSEAVLGVLHELLAERREGNGLRCFRFAFLRVSGNDGRRGTGWSFGLSLFTTSSRRITSHSEQTKANQRKA